MPVKRYREVENLNQTISATYAPAEVQAISDKVDELLDELKQRDMESQ